MSGRTHRVKDVARLARITVRTLHHYDEIGLLVPSGRSAAGYRLYGDADLLRLQQILIARELGLSLEEIKGMLDDPAFDRRKALLEHRARLHERAHRIEAMIRSMDAALAAMEEGGKSMNPAELFDGFDPAEHEEEARQRWGGTSAYAESARRTARYSAEDWARIRAENDALMGLLAERLAAGARPDDERVVELAERYRQHIDRWYYPCDRRMHAALARMYVADERFTAAFDKHAPGLAEFLAEAIRANADRD